jgi:hypothetical protein
MGILRTEVPPVTVERRAHRRYPLELTVEYRIVGSEVSESAVCVGRILNLSSAGLIFESAKPLPAGLQVELSITWPSRDGPGVGTKLHAVGRTVRADGPFTAVEIEQSCFRSNSQSRTTFSD